MTTVRTVTTAPPSAGNMTLMDGRQVLKLTTRITITDGHIEGVVRVSGGPGQVFSGWSELFAVLTQLVSGAGGTSDNRDANWYGAS
jgi:hypothetical protein